MTVVEYHDGRGIIAAGGVKSLDSGLREAIGLEHQKHGLRL